jgi:hypothetical protein
MELKLPLKAIRSGLSPRRADDGSDAFTLRMSLVYAGDAYNAIRPLFDTIF